MEYTATQQNLANTLIKSLQGELLRLMYTKALEGLVIFASGCRAMKCKNQLESVFGCGKGNCQEQDAKEN